MIQFSKVNDALGSVNRGIPCESGLFTLCDASCKGKCETWLSCLEGRKMLYPRRFGHSTSGAHHISAVGIGYHGLRIQGMLTVRAVFLKTCQMTEMIVSLPMLTLKRNLEMK